MVEQICGDDPEPSQRVPAGLFVPVRPGPSGWVARLFRTPLGERTAVGFTTSERLAATFGTDQPWIELAEPALRALAEPLGIAALTVDPQLAAPAVRPARQGEPRRERQPRPVGVLSDARVWIG
jgi:hypothetical protein